MGKKKSDGGKGDRPRPLTVTTDQYRLNWDRTFGLKQTKKEKKDG